MVNPIFAITFKLIESEVKWRKQQQQQQQPQKSMMRYIIIA